MTHCKLCGAPREPAEKRCPYCGTPYQREKVAVAVAMPDPEPVTVNINDNQIARMVAEIYDGILTPNEARRLMGLREL